MGDDEVYDQHKDRPLHLVRQVEPIGEVTGYGLASSPLQVSMAIEQIKQDAIASAHRWLYFEHLDPETRAYGAAWQLQKAAVRIARLEPMLRR